MLFADVTNATGSFRGLRSDFEASRNFMPLTTDVPRTSSAQALNARWQGVSREKCLVVSGVFEGYYYVLSIRCICHM